jgi:hypothetical protein
MKMLTGKESTADLDKLGEIDEIWETLMRSLTQREHLDEYVPFPSIKDGGTDSDGKIKIDNYQSVR